MSHLIVEVTKILPIKNTVLIVANNWIVDGILYYPNETFSAAYKKDFVAARTPPDVEKWESYEYFQI